MAKARIAVVGAGLMGHGIAQVFALAGHEVKITDTVVKNLDTVAAETPASAATSSSFGALGRCIKLYPTRGHGVRKGGLQALS